jgi:hypothetical protein
MPLALSVLKWVGIGLLVLVAVLFVGLVLVPPVTRGLTDAWGATPDEAVKTLPGDGLIPAKREISTKAVTIDAPPSVVYALLVQMGQHRAGWYGWDWFYNLTKSSDFVDGHYSTRIVPELQDLKVGDKISINDMVSYDVVQADKDKALVLAAGSMKASELPMRSMPETWTENTMAFVIEPLPNDQSRLILRMRADGTETGFGRWIWNGPLNFGGALFSHKTIVGLKRVAEQIAAEQTAAK